MVGNKVDLCNHEESERDVSTEEGEQCAAVHQMPYFESSAKEDIGVKEFMDDIMERVYQEHLIKISQEEDEDEEGKNTRKTNPSIILSA